MSRGPSTQSLFDPSARLLNVAFCVALCATSSSACDTGPEGPPGKTVVGPKGALGESGRAAPSIAAIEPHTVYLHRKRRVLISGSGTKWSGSKPPVVDFGTGIAVDPASVVVASPTALAAIIDVTPEAAIGLRNVRVTSGEGADEETAEYAAAFDVQPSLDAVLAGTHPFDSAVPQGSIVQAVVVERDPTTPYDPFPANVTMAIGDGSRVHPSPFNSADPAYQAVFFLFADVKADLGSQPIIGSSGPPGSVVDSSTAADFLEVVGRQPVPLSMGVNTETFVVPSESRLFSAVVPEEHVITFKVKSADPLAGADVYVLPPSGKFDDSAGNDDIVPVGFPAPVHTDVQLQALVPQAGPYYLVYRDFALHAGYQFQIEVEKQACPAVHLTGTQNGAITTAGEADCYSFMADAGQHVTVALTGAGPDTCGLGGTIQSEVVLVDGATGKRLAVNDDHGATRCAALSADIEKQGTYYVKVAASQHWAPQKTFQYSLGYQLQ